MPGPKDDDLRIACAAIPTFWKSCADLLKHLFDSFCRLKITVIVDFLPIFMSLPLNPPSGNPEYANPKKDPQPFIFFGFSIRFLTPALLWCHGLSCGCGFREENCWILSLVETTAERGWRTANVTEVPRLTPAVGPRWRQTQAGAAIGVCYSTGGIDGHCADHAQQDWQAAWGYQLA